MSAAICCIATQFAALEPRLRLVAPSTNGSRTVLPANWTADLMGIRAVLPGGGQLPAGQYIVQVRTWSHFAGPSGANSALAPLCYRAASCLEHRGNRLVCCSQMRGSYSLLVTVQHHFHRHCTGRNWCSTLQASLNGGNDWAGGISGERAVCHFNPVACGNLNHNVWGTISMSVPFCVVTVLDMTLF